MKTKPSEFVKFHKLLMSSAPDDYVPWYIPVVANNKAPDGLAISAKAPPLCTICNKPWVYDSKSKKIKCPNCGITKGSWKAPWARLSYEEALQRLEQGLNNGIAARSNDRLNITDIDSFDLIHLAPDTLINSSRKKTGVHAFTWWDDKREKINIPVDGKGENRASDQYVVSAGSYCETNIEDIKNEKLEPEFENAILKNPDLGIYTVANAKPPIKIQLEDLPQFFLDELNKVEEQIKTQIKSTTIKPTGPHSTLYDLKITDIVTTQRNAREPHPLHESTTNMNWSISDEKDENGNDVVLGHCWRDSVSLNALQFLVVKSGYMSCKDAGTGHEWKTKKGGAGPSKVTGDYGAIFHAWIQAKKDKLIPIDDPMPRKAMIYVARKHKLVAEDFDEKYPDIQLPNKVYNQVLKIVEVEY